MATDLYSERRDRRAMADTAPLPNTAPAPPGETLEEWLHNQMGRHGLEAKDKAGTLSTEDVDRLFVVLLERDSENAYFAAGSLRPRVLCTLQRANPGATSPDCEQAFFEALAQVMKSRARSYDRNRPFYPWFVAICQKKLRWRFKHLRRYVEVQGARIAASRCDAGDEAVSVRPNEDQKLAFVRKQLGKMSPYSRDCVSGEPDEVIAERHGKRTRAVQNNRAKLLERVRNLARRDGLVGPNEAPGAKA